MGKCLIVPGGTSAELIGTALPEHVIEGQTFYNTNEEELLTGEIPVQGDVTITPTESIQNAYVTGKYMEGDVKVGAISKTYVGSGVTRQAAKTVSPTESEQTVVANGVYTTGAVKVGAISSTYVGSGVTKRTSSNLSVSSAGLITASAGYYSSAATKQLTTTAAKTITPSTASQTAVNAGVYTTGAIKVAAIPSTTVGMAYNVTGTATSASLKRNFTNWDSSTVYMYYIQIAMPSNVTILGFTANKSDALHDDRCATTSTGMVVLYYSDSASSYTYKYDSLMFTGGYLYIPVGKSSTAYVYEIFGKYTS